jgi:DNA (cytosine-5)-methyltransferase 1
VAPLKAVDLYCGAGGMSLGFMEAGFEVVAAVDSNPLNVEVHRDNLPAAPCWEADLGATSGRSILRRCGLRAGEVSVVFGGPPCQGFSEIGHRRRNDQRNEQVVRFAELVCQIQPRYFVMENVRGLLFRRHRKTVRRFVEKARSGGYEVVEPVRVLDASAYGVPQRRLRAFFLGFRRGESPPSYPDPVGEAPTVWDAIGDLPDVDAFPELADTDIYDGPLGAPSRYALALRLGRPAGSGLTGCGQTKHADGVRRRFARTAPGACEARSRCYRLAEDEVSFTLRAGTGPEAGSFTAARPIHPALARCITVREAARLHSFPDWFDFHSTKWHAFRQIGNSVPPLLAKAVAAAIARACAGDDVVRPNAPQGDPCQRAISQTA